MEADDFHRLCLAGRFFTDSARPSNDSAESSLRRQWNLSEDDMKVFTLFDQDTILFGFKLESDKEKALEDGPWYVNGVLLVLKDWSTDLDTDFTSALFCVNLVGLPLNWYNEEKAEDAISWVMHRPIQFLSDPSRRVFKVLAEIYLKEPLKPGFNLSRQRFVQFTYCNLQSFCYKCGMIDHIDKDCDRTTKFRRLNRRTKTVARTYGPWLRQGHELPDRVEISFSEKQSEKNMYEETVPYPQFFIEFSVYEMYRCEDKMEGSQIPEHFVSRKLYGGRFRFPCSYLETESGSGDYPSRAFEVFTQEFLRNVPFAMYRWESTNLMIKMSDADTTKEDAIVQNLVDYLKFIKNSEDYSDRKWLHLELQINKTTLLTREDYEETHQEHQAARFRGEIEQRISEMIKRRIANNEDLISVLLWRKSLKNVLAGIDKNRLPFSLAERAEQARREALQLLISGWNAPKPANEAAVQKLERLRVMGHDMDTFDPCTICMEKMFLGEEAIRMPCSHVFHRCCIEQWLRTCHRCPICRFELPSRQ